MSFSFRNIFSPDDQNPNPGADSGESSEFPSSLERGNPSPQPAPIKTEVHTFLVSELLPYIPKAIAAQSGIPMDKEIAVPLPLDGSLDVRLSSIFGACPELFAAEITPWNDSVVTLPPRLGPSVESETAPQSEKSGFANSFSQSGGEGVAAFWSPVTPSSDTNVFQGKPSEKTSDSKQENQPWSGGNWSSGLLPDTPSSSKDQPTAQSPGFSGGASASGDAFQTASENTPFSSLFGHSFAAPTPAQESKGEANPKENEAASVFGNPFQAAEGFSTLFSQQRVEDQSIPFPNTEIQPENHPQEVEEEPEGVWGAMFRGIDSQTESAAAKDANPPYASIGNLLKQTSTAESSEANQPATPVSETKFAGFTAPSSIPSTPANSLSAPTDAMGSQKFDPFPSGNDSAPSSFRSSSSAATEPNPIPANPFQAAPATPPTLPPDSAWTTPTATPLEKANPFEAFGNASDSWAAPAANTPPPLPVASETPSTDQTPVFHGFEPSSTTSVPDAQPTALAASAAPFAKTEVSKEKSFTSLDSEGKSSVSNENPVFSGFSQPLEQVVLPPAEEQTPSAPEPEEATPSPAIATATNGFTAQEPTFTSETPVTSVEASLQPRTPVLTTAAQKQEESSFAIENSSFVSDSRSVAQTETLHPSSSASPRVRPNADDPDRDLELCAIFSTSERFTLAKVARKVVSLQGIESCSLSIPGQFVQASRKEESRSSQEAREMVASLRNFAKFAGLKDAHTFTMQTDQGVVSVFLDGESCLTVQHSSTSFAPGVREKLILVSRCIARLQD